MKSTGIVRKIDNLGRIVIPKEIRNNLKIEDNASLEIFTDNNSIVLKRSEEFCLLCGSSQNIIKYKNKPICKKCANDLNNMIKK